MARTRVISTVLFTASWLAAATAVAGQGTATVRGSVFDSLTMEPLDDAAVFLWDTPFRTATDSLGRFTLTGVPAGRYDLLYFHERLGRLGVSVGPRSVEVVQGGVHQVDLATPSMLTMVAAECMLEEYREGTGIVAGWVGDTESGMGLPGATVSLSWNVDGSKAPERMSLVADNAGWYHACDAPSEVPIIASAHFLNRNGLRKEVRVEEHGTAEAGFLLGRYRPADINGHLVDEGSGASVREAEVWLRGTDFRGITGPDGHFQFRDVPPGTYMLMTNHLSYGTKMDTLDVPSGEHINVEMLLDPEAIEMAPLTVTVESAPLEQRAMGGLTIDRVTIEKFRTRVRDIGDILRTQNVPGVIVKRSEGHLCIGYTTGQVRMFRNDCQPMLIFIDNVRTSNSDLAAQISPDAIERIVVYKPVEAGNLFGMGAANGVLAIFTRSH